MATATDIETARERSRWTPPWGLLFSIPLLRRIHRRFRTWVAPGIAVVVFAAMYSVSALVIGPAISGSSETGPTAPAPTPTVVDEHAVHH